MHDTRTLEEKRAYYIDVIAQRSPPKTSADEFMLEVYKVLLEDVDQQILRQKYTP